MKRDIIRQLLKWKDSDDRKPLILTGVRQCGKTYSLKEFGTCYFDEVAYFNFEQNQFIASAFEYDYDVERILRELTTAVHGKKIAAGKTLVVLMRFRHVLKPSHH